MSMTAKDCRPGMWYEFGGNTWLILSVVPDRRSVHVIHFLHTTVLGLSCVTHGNYAWNAEVFGVSWRLDTR